MRYPKRHQDLLLATAEQSRETDRRTIEELGIPGETLMEIAGLGAAVYISSEFPKDRPLLFVCGKGNNAGDAFVCARALLNDGYHITLYPVFGTGDLSDDAARNLKRLKQIEREMKPDITIWDQWQDPSPFGLIVDGLFGTGLRSTVKTPVSDIIEQINLSGRPVCALDIPSGLHCDTGDILGTVIRADFTLQFGLRKLGCYLGDGPACAGIRKFIPLPFPFAYKKTISVRLTDEDWEPMDLLTRTHRRSDFTSHSGTVQVGSMHSDTEIPDSTASYSAASESTASDSAASDSITVRQKTVDTRLSGSSLHKYNNGVVHVIGGSAGLTGAPLYTARAAWSLGMGAVSLIHPSAWSVAMASQAPELIKKPVGPSDAAYFTKQQANEVLAFLQDKPGVTVIGPGVGRNKQTAEFVRRTIRESSGPIIIDADGLRCITGYEETITRRKNPELVILTPHTGELSHLTQVKPSDDAARLHQTVNLSERLGCTVLAKGYPVLVHTSGGFGTLLTGYDTTPFARAGFGDILAGHIAAFFSRTGNPQTACEAGLIYGLQKLTATSTLSTRFPEPLDLL